jgi:ATP-binding cassette subfamily C protein
MSERRLGGLSRDLRRRVGLLTRAERLRWLSLFPVGVVAAALESVGGVVVFALIGALVQPAAASAPAATIPWLQRALAAATPLELTWLAAALYVVKNGILLAAVYYRAHVGGEIAQQLSARVTRAYVAAPYLFHVRRNSAELSQNVLEGIPAVVRLLDAVVTLTTEALVVLGLTLLLLRVAVVETLVAAIIVGGIVGLFIRAMRGRYHRLGARHFELSAQVLRTLQHALGGIKQVKAFGREAYFGDALARDDGARTRIFIQHAALETVPRLLTESAFVLGLVALVVAIQLRSGSSAALLPVLGLYAYAGIRMIPAGHRLAVQAGNIRFELAGTAALCRDVDALAALAPGDRPVAGAPADIPLRRRLSLEGVSYAYDRRTTQVLSRIDLAVERGECVALVGATGTGKTTLVDLVLGLIEPTEGRITVDGVAIAHNLPAWRRHIGYVPQDPFMVDDTLRRNIAFGLTDAEIDASRVAAAVGVAQLEPFIATLPDGLDTLVGERGVRLSGGERQRVSIARALYRDPDLLVFDEATSALDPGTEQALTRAIERLKGQKTLLVIAHRLTTVERADRLVVLSDGRIEATGTYHDLLRGSPAFRSLAALAG